MLLRKEKSCLCWETKCDLLVIQPVDWKLHQLPNSGNYTDCPTLETTPTARRWKLHQLPNPGNYTDCPTLETPQTAQPWKLHWLPNPRNYIDCPTLETTLTAQPWKLHRLPEPGYCWNLFLQEIPFRSSKGEFGNYYTECNIWVPFSCTAQDPSFLGRGAVSMGKWFLLLWRVMVMSYSGLISPRKMDCMTLNVMALISLKTSRTAE